MQSYFLFFALFFLLIFSGALFLKNRRFKFEFDKKEEELLQKEEGIKRKMYELAILKELGERIGYSLNLQNIIDIITGSLHQFMEYGAVSYVLLEPEKIVFKVHLEKSVSRKFIDEIKDRMFKSLSALLNTDFNIRQIEETISGAILIEEIDEPVKSFFNIPLVIGGKVMGILTVAHTTAGLYKEEDMTILYKITNQVSQAVTRLQEVVEIEKKKLNAMVHSMYEGVVMTDKDYRILVANYAVKKAIGIEDIEEPTIFDFINHMEGKFDIRGKLEESIKLEKILESGDIVLHDRFYQIFVSPVKTKTIFENKEEILGGVAIFRDITHKKELDKLREDFTSMMVHELRSPLDGIKKMSEILQKSDTIKDKDIFLDYPKMIFSSSSNMLQLINDLLDVAKIEAGKFKIVKETTDFRNIIKERLNFYSVLTKDSKLDIKTIIDENVPLKISIDPFRIIQVLNNFISNSIKFSKEGGYIEIQVLKHLKGWDILEEAQKLGLKWFITDDVVGKFSNLSDSLIVAVTDNGVGMSNDGINKIFNKFEQLQTSSKDGEKTGTGLGLIINKGIIEAHQGTIGAGSEEKKGSTFYFTVPLV